MLAGCDATNSLSSLSLTHFAPLVTQHIMNLSSHLYPSSELNLFRPSLSLSSSKLSLITHVSLEKAISFVEPDFSILVLLSLLSFFLRESVAILLPVLLNTGQFNLCVCMYLYLFRSEAEE